MPMAESPIGRDVPAKRTRLGNDEDDPGKKAKIGTLPKRTRADDDEEEESGKKARRGINCVGVAAKIE